MSWQFWVRTVLASRMNSWVTMQCVRRQEAEEPGAESKLRNLAPKDLLEQLPVMQRLMQRLMDCMPKGAAARDWVVQMALLTVAKESFQVCP